MASIESLDVLASDELPSGVAGALCVLRAWALGTGMGAMDVRSAREASVILGQNRLLGLTADILLGAAPDPQISETVASFRHLTAQMNGANLLMMRRLTGLLEDIPERVVFYKGVVLQNDLYGTLFARPSSDIDLLTAPGDYARVAGALQTAGYSLDPHTDTVWWRRFLAEQQFRSSEHGPNIDLHHRLQQPGCPMPRQAGRLLAAAERRPYLGREILTFRQDHTLLVAAMSLVKALHHHEPAGRYVGDAERLLRRLTSDEWDGVMQEARIMGLSGTLDLAIRCVDVVFATIPASRRRPVLNDIPDVDLQRMLLDPRNAPNWIRRRKLLHALCDRPTDAISAWMVMAASETARLTSAPRRPTEAG